MHAVDTERVRHIGPGKTAAFSGQKFSTVYTTWSSKHVLSPIT